MQPKGSTNKSRAKQQTEALLLTLHAPNLLIHFITKLTNDCCQFCKVSDLLSIFFQVSVSTIVFMNCVYFIYVRIPSFWNGALRLACEYVDRTSDIMRYYQPTTDYCSARLMFTLSNNLSVSRRLCKECLQMQVTLFLLSCGFLSYFLNNPFEVNKNAFLI